MRPRLRSEHSAVSEVLGTILILLITVILFSSIILWVSALPAPSAGRSVAFEGNLTGNYVGGMWQGASVELVHLGGEDLNEGGTRIYLTINNNTEVLKTRGTFFDGMSVKPYGVADLDGVWRIGADWAYLNETIPQGAAVSVLVVDLDKGIVLWRENLSSLDGEDAPVFLDKWFDSDTSTANRDPVRPGDLFTVFARVIDPDDDLNPASVWAYLTFGTNGTPLGYIQLLDDGGAGDQVANDGIFTRQLPYSAQQTWDGGIIILNATDTVGHARATRLILRIGAGSLGGFFPFNGTWNSTLGGIGQGDSGPNGDQGWNIYNATGLPSASDPAGSPTRVFAPGETVYIIVRATLIQNAANINSMVLRDATGFTLYPATKEFDSRDPAKNDPAFTQTATSPFFEYQYSFAAPGAAGSYSVELTLKDNAGHALLYGTDTVWIDTGGGPPIYPKIVTYLDPNRDGNYSDLVESTTFNVTDSLIIRVFFRDRDNDLGSCGSWFNTSTCPAQLNTFAGDVEIVDYYGGTPIKRRPGNMPVSLLSTFAYDQGAERTYVLYMNLLRRDQDPWLGGANFYTLRIRTIADFGLGGTTAESYLLLARQVEIIAPSSTIDIVSNTEQDTGNNDRGVYWYDSSHGWQEHNIDLLPEDVKKPLAMATGDLNGDTRVDVVIGLDSEEVTNIIAYFNLDHGRTWRREFINQFGENPSFRAESLAIGDLDGDGDGELVAGIRDAGGGGVGVVVFWNDGVWTGQDLQYSEGGSPPDMRSVAIGDINDDGRPDVVSGDQDGIVNYYCNNIRGAFLPGADTPCPGKTSLAPPLDANGFNTGVKVGDAGAIDYNSLRLGRMEGLEADDPTLDIVVNNGEDLIIYRTVLGGVPSWIRYDVVESGEPIVNLIIQSLAVGDMNNDGMLDIVSGIRPTTQTDSDTNVTRILRMADPGLIPALTAEARLSSFDADGFTLDWTTVDAVARQVLAWAIGGTGAGGGLSVNKGAFLRSPTPGLQTITGVGFQPKVIILFSEGDTAEGFSPNADLSWGWAVSPTARYSLGVAAPDNDPIGGGDSRFVNNRAFTILTGTGPTVSGEADLVSFDPDGFTLNWITNDGVRSIIHYFAIGGGDLANVRAGDFASNTTIRNQTVTGLGFQPKLVLLMANGGDAFPAQRGKAVFALGMMVSSAQQGAEGQIMNAEPGRADEAGGFQRTDRSLIIPGDADGTDAEYRFISMDADGFTVNITKAPERPIKIAYLAFGGPNLNAAVGSFNQPLVTGAQPITGVGFQPDGLWLSSWNRPASTGGSADAKHSSGAASAPGVEGGMWGGSLDNPSKGDVGVYRLRNRGMNPGPPPTFNPWLSALLPRTVIDPDTGSPATYGRIKDLALGDTDNDGDLDIVFVSDRELQFLNNLWHLENRGDIPATYVHTNIYTDGFFQRREKAFAVETDYIDL